MLPASASACALTAMFAHLFNFEPFVPPLPCLPPAPLAPPPVAHHAAAHQPRRGRMWTRASELRQRGTVADGRASKWRCRALTVLGAMMPGEARLTCLALGGVQTVEARVDALVEGGVVSLRRSSRAKRSKLTNLRNRGLVSHAAAQASAIAAFVTDSADGGATGGPVDFIASVNVFDDANMWIRKPDPEGLLLRGRGRGRGRGVSTTAKALARRGKNTHVPVLNLSETVMAVRRQVGSTTDVVQGQRDDDLRSLDTVVDTTWLGRWFEGGRRHGQIECDYRCRTVARNRNGDGQPRHERLCCEALARCSSLLQCLCSRRLQRGHAYASKVLHALSRLKA